jgi:hypothetical protein
VIGSVSPFQQSPGRAVLLAVLPHVRGATIGVGESQSAREIVRARKEACRCRVADPPPSPQRGPQRELRGAGPLASHGAACRRRHALVGKISTAYVG